MGFCCHFYSDIFALYLKLIHKDLKYVLVKRYKKREKLLWLFLLSIHQEEVTMVQTVASYTIAPESLFNSFISSFAYASMSLSCNHATSIVIRIFFNIFLQS